MILRNKKGEEFVEAAIVLPLTILAILSMITVAVFLFEFEVSQSETHTSLAEEAARSELPIGIKKKTASHSGISRGL